MRQPLRIALAASECAPFAKTGGLADVTGALARALWRRGHDVRVFLPAYRRVLFLGNAHVQQIAAALVGQQATTNNNIVRIDLLHAETQTIRVTLANEAVVVLLNDARILVSDDWQDIIAEDLAHDPELQALTDFDALILGLFNDCAVQLKSQAYECESMTDIMFRQIADIFPVERPILFVSEMAATRSDESTVVRDLIRYYREVMHRKTMWFIAGRRYISKVSSMEGAAPHTVGNATLLTHDAINSGGTARSMPRCQGAYGGHADLLAFDVTEFLYNQLL